MSNIQNKLLLFRLYNLPCRLFIAGCIISGITNIMFGFLPMIKSGSLFLALSLIIRSMTAVGESAMSTAVYPLAMRCDTRSQSTVLAIMETMFGAGTTIGPFVGGFLFEYGGFLLPFATCGGLLLLSGFVALWLLKDTETTDDTTSDESSDDSEESDDVGVVVVRGSYRSLLCSPLIIVSALVTFLTGVSTQWYQPSLEPYVRQQFGLSSFQVRFTKHFKESKYRKCVHNFDDGIEFFKTTQLNSACSS